MVNSPAMIMPVVEFQNCWSGGERVSSTGRGHCHVPNSGRCSTQQVSRNLTCVKVLHVCNMHIHVCVQSLPVCMCMCACTHACALCVCVCVCVCMHPCVHPCVCFTFLYFLDRGFLYHLSTLSSGTLLWTLLQCSGPISR